MKTEILYAPDITCTLAINRAGEILEKGGLVAIPTETVYGLAASAFNENSIKNIYIAKGRPGDNPLIVHISDFDELNGITTEITNECKECMSAFWPGPFTAVVKKTDKIPYAVSGGLDTVAIRMPSHPVARAVIKASGVPLAAPSANISGSPSPTSASHVINDLDGKIDAVLVSTDCEFGVESTVVSFAVNPPRLLRPGGITPEQLREIIPNLVIDPAVLSEPEKGAKVSSPGMKYKHYSPKANMVMAIGTSTAFATYCKENSEKFDLVLGFDEDEKILNMPFLSMGTENDPLSQAELLFSKLREIDKKGFKNVIAHAPKKDGIGLAVYNRLIRAAGFQVIEL